MKQIQTIFLYLFITGSIYSQNYLPGDTLNVVAINGLNLREAPNLKSSIITLLNNGEKVLILKSDEQVEDESEGFQGHWVKIQSLNSNIEGFVFDAYISQFPVLTEFDFTKDFISGKYRWEDDDMYDFLPAMLEEYALKVFQKTSCQLFYSSGSDGEGAFSLDLIQLNGKVTLIEHGYTEGHGIELELPNPRISEVYYLIKNILKYVPNEISKIDDERIKNVKEYGQECIKIGEHPCIMRIIHKNDNVISILFNNACC